MADRIKPCNSHNGRHKWDWLYNRMFWRKTPTGHAGRLRGLYFCPWCKQKRWGAPPP